MYRHLTVQDWQKIFEEADKSPVSNIEWCRLNNMHYRSFTAHKYRMRKKGLLYAESKAVEFTDVTDAFFEYMDEESQKRLYFYPKKLSRINTTTLMVIVTRVMKKKVCSGEQYLFLKEDMKTMYVLKWNGYGYSITKCRKQRGKIPWPQKNKAFSQTRMQQLLEMI